MIEYLILVINVLCAIDIYRDSRNRRHGYLYPVMGLILGVFGLVIYNLIFNGKVSLAVRFKAETGKIGSFGRFGATFILLGSLFFMGGLVLMINETERISSMFLLFAGIVVIIFGKIFMMYDRKQRVIKSQ